MDSIVDIARNKMHQWTLPLTSYYLRRKLKTTDFSIIASNCIGTRIYRELGIEYTSPFIGLFICAPDYIVMLKDLARYLSLPLEFVEKSKYDGQGNFVVNYKYPIGQLGDKIEIHFLYNRNREEAKINWNRRLKRINWKNLFITFTDRDFCTKELLCEFDSLPFQRKVCFTAKHIPAIGSSVWVKDYCDQSYVGDLYTNYRVLKKYFDFVAWLNLMQVS